MARVFISYRHVEPDQGLAEAIHGHVRANGIDSFLDIDSIPIGGNWEKEIGRHLRAADYFIVLLSEEAVPSDMVQYEVVEARKQSNTTMLPVRFPTLKEPTYSIGAHLRAVQYTTWDPSDGHGDICGRLLMAIKTGEPAGEGREPMADCVG